MDSNKLNSREPAVSMTVQREQGIDESVRSRWLWLAMGGYWLCGRMLLKRFETPRLRPRQSDSKLLVDPLLATWLLGYRATLFSFIQLRRCRYSTRTKICRVK